MFKVIKNKFKNYRKICETIKELNSLTDKELSDIGINRVDIRKVAKSN